MEHLDKQNIRFWKFLIAWTKTRQHLKGDDNYFLSLGHVYSTIGILRPK